MSRAVKRVPMDFNHPIGKVWPGYLCPEDIVDVDDDGEAVDEWYENESYGPPEGEGWQMWETVSEGSPMSPVFETKEELAHWLADTKASACGVMTATYEDWLATIEAGHSCASMVFEPGVCFISGVEMAGRMARRDKEA